MHKAIILHGTGNTSQGNWFPWLTSELKKRGWAVWSPDLPNAEKPDIERYARFFTGTCPFQLDSDTTIIGHSSGAVAALGILQAQSQDVCIHSCILVSAFINDLGWDVLRGLFLHPYSYEVIKQRAKHFVIYHSDNDPYIPLEQAKTIKTLLGGDLRVIPGAGHFNTESHPPYMRFPEILESVTA